MSLLTSNYKNAVLILLIFFLVLPKWILGFFVFDLSQNVNLIINFNDIQYFPLIFNLSNLNFGQSYIEYFDNPGSFATLLSPLILHALFYKFAGLGGMIFLEIIFQLILIFLIFQLAKKIFQSNKISFFLCFTTFGSIIIVNYFDINILNYFFGHTEGILGSRVPRPIFSSIFLFLFLNCALELREQLNKEIEIKYLLLLSFSLGMLINSFLFYFLNCFILLLFLFFLIKKKDSFSYIYYNFKKLILFIFSLFIFCIPFILQFIFKEEDHAVRMGLFTIDFGQKLFFVKNYIYYLARAEVIIVILISLSAFFYSNYKKNSPEIFNLNIFFYFFILSIFVPIIFVLISNNIISIHHFILIARFSGFFYLTLFFFFIFFVYFNFKNYLKFLFNNVFITIILLVFIYMNFEISKKKISNQYDTINDYTQIEKFLKINNFKNTKSILFSNDSGVNILWLLQNNTELLFSDGWANSLKDEEIEYLFFNSLKVFNINQEDFDNFLLFDQRLERVPLFLFLYNYKYQANSLRTFSEISNYDAESRKIIQKTSFFRPQQQIVPENEKKRLSKDYSSHIINKNLEPNIVILYEKTFPFEVSKSKYIKIKKLNNLAIYKK